MTEVTRDPVRSPTYDLFGQAMAARSQIFCIYDGYPRELCPHIFGHTKGQEVGLTYQFGGQSKRGLRPGGEWRCLLLSKVRSRSARRWTMACRLQPQSAATLRRNRQYRRQPVEPVSSEAKIMALMSGVRLLTRSGF